MSENPKNILLIMSKFPPEYSGPGVRMPKLYNWLKEKGENYNVQVLCNGVEQIKNEKYLYQDFPVRRITAEYLNQAFSYLKIIPKKLSHFVIYQYEFFKTLIILFFSKSYRNTHLLHILGHSGGTAAGLLYANLKKIPVLLELVNAEAMPYQKILNIITCRVPKKSVVAYLTYHASKQHTIYNQDMVQKWIKPNPIDISIFNYEHINYEAREKYSSFSRDDIVLLSVAKFMPRKNQIFLIDVLADLPEKFKLILAGPKIEAGPNYNGDLNYLQTIKTNISQKQLTDRVLVIEDYVLSSVYMKLSDLYFMPAWGEGLGTPMLEAIACGLPVVANANEPAFCEWIKNGHNGQLVPIDSASQWRDAVINLSDFDPVKRTKISEEMKSSVNNEIINSQYLQHIKTLMKV